MAPRRMVGRSRRDGRTGSLDVGDTALLSVMQRYGSDYNPKVKGIYRRLDQSSETGHTAQEVSAGTICHAVDSLQMIVEKN